MTVSTASALAARATPTARVVRFVGSDAGASWFEYAPSDASAFDELVAALRATPEWRYVDRETDVRLVRDHAH